MKQKPEKILIVGLYPNEACPLFTKGLAKAFVDLGAEVYVMLPSDLEDIRPWSAFEGLAGVFFVRVNGTSGVIGKLKKLNNYIALKSHLRDNPRFYEANGFDCVMYTFYHRWNSFIDKFVIAKERILFLHDPIPHSGERARLLRLMKKSASRMDRVVVLTKSFITLVSEEYGIPLERIYYMPHPLIDEPLGKHIAQDYQCDSASSTQFLFFGRICEYKGIGTLIEAYSQVEKLRDDVCLTVAGNGDFSTYSAAFAQLHSADLINRYIKEDEIAELFSRPNGVLVVPYVDATQSGVISLAYSYGVPVIASDTGGLREQLDDGRVGLLCQPGDTEALANAMIAIADDPDYRMRQSEAMSTIAKTLGWSGAVDVLMEQLQQKEGDDGA